MQRLAREAGAFDAVPADHFAQGGAGATELGRAVMRMRGGGARAELPPPVRRQSRRHPSKIEAIVREVYGGAGVEYDAALKRIALYEADAALRGLPICMSKTQYSLSDDPTKLGAPKDFVVTVRDLYVSAGAGFLVVSLGDITFIPGLPIKPAYYKIDVSSPTERRRGGGAVVSAWVVVSILYLQVSSMCTSPLIDG